MSEQYQNLATTTCTGSLDNSTNPTTIVVAAGAGASFPATTNGPFRITVCDGAGTNAEVMLVTTRATDTMTATRGAWSATVGAQETPTPTLSTHSAGSTVVHCITAGVMDQIRIDSQNVGTAAGLPSSSKPGDLYLPTDGVQLFRSSSSGTYAPWGPLYPLVAPPSSGWTAVNTLAGDSITYANNYITWSKNGADASIAGYVRPVIASKSYTLTAAMNFANGCNIASNFATGGLLLTNGTTNTSSTIEFKYQYFGSVTSLIVDTSNNFGTAASYTTHYSLPGYSFQSPIFLRVVENATNRTYYISADGQTWIQVFQHAVTTDFTTTDYGIFQRVNGGASGLTLFSWKETNP